MSIRALWAVFSITEALRLSALAAPKRFLMTSPVPCSSGRHFRRLIFHRSDSTSSNRKPARPPNPSVHTYDLSGKNTEISVCPTWRYTRTRLYIFKKTNSQDVPLTICKSGLILRQLREPLKPQEPSEPCWHSLQLSYFQ